MIGRRNALGWSVAVLIFVLCLVWDTPELQAQSRPTFAPLDAGGVPSNLIELAPHAFSKGEILPTGSYVIWAAIKKPGTPFLNAAWKRYGPYTPTGGQRYVADYEGDIRGISLGNFTNAQYASLKQTEVQINIDNWYSETAFFVINTAAGGLAGSPAVFPAGGVPAVHETRKIAGAWIQYDCSDGGNCNGTIITFRQDSNGTVTSVEGNITCEGGRATATYVGFNIRWVRTDTLAYSYRITSRSVDRIHDGENEITFKSDSAARSAGRDVNGNTGWGEWRRR